MNFAAFGEVAEEYHNELYGFMDLQGWLDDFKQGKTQYQYTRENKNHVVYTQQLIKTEIIRHQIHHPENTHNPRFTRQELLDSIETMRTYIRTKAENEGLWQPAAQY